MRRTPNTRWVLGACTLVGLLAAASGCLFSDDQAAGDERQSPSTPQLGAPVPFAPSANRTNVSASLVLFSWTRVPGAVAYELYAGPDTNPPLIVTTDQTTYQLLDLPTCTVHYWRVVAVGETQRTSSAVWKFTTSCP